MIDGLMMGLDKIKLGWYKFKEATGIGDSKENQAAISQISADIEARKKAISEAGTKVKEDLLNAKKSLSGIEMHWGDPKEKVDATTGAATTTQDALIQSANGGGTAGGSTGMAPLGVEATKGTSAVATGGTRSTNISINLKDLVGTINFQGTLQEKKEEMERTLAEAMLRVLNMAQSSVS